MMGLPDGRKSFDMFSLFDTIPACDGQPASQPASHVDVTSTALIRRAGKNHNSTVCAID